MADNIAPGLPSANAFIDLINKTELTYEQLKEHTNLVLPAVAPQDLSGKVVIVTGANVGMSCTHVVCVC